MIRLTAQAEVREVISERLLSNGLYEVELYSEEHGNPYKAIMSEIQTPSPEMCTFLIEHLPNVGEFEEYEILDMAHAILRDEKKAFHINAVADVIPYLCRVGLISYEKKPTPQHGSRFFFKRSATPDKIRNTLDSPPPPPTLDEAKKRAQSVSEKKKKKKKKKKRPVNPSPKLPPKKKKGDTAKPEDAPPKKKKKKKKKKKPCCDDPRPVKSKKTGKRRCKNCGTKLPPKKEKK